MKAITLTQPWATLVAIGAKRIETRSWSTRYRGPLAIHAAKAFPRQARELRWQPAFAQVLQFGHEFDDPLPLGKVVAVCELVACVRIISVPCAFVSGILACIIIPPNEPELSFGDYTPGRWAWILSDVQALENPLPATGKLGLWDCALEVAPLGVKTE